MKALIIITTIIIWAMLALCLFSVPLLAQEIGPHISNNGSGGGSSSSNSESDHTVDPGIATPSPAPLDGLYPLPLSPSDEKSIVLYFVRREERERAERLLMQVRRAGATVRPPYTEDGRTPKDVVCVRNSRGQCARGSVRIDPWFKRALSIQRHLQSHRPWHKTMMLGSHNSHIDYADGYGLSQGDLTRLVQLVDPSQMVQISNHWLTVTDQMEMGVRQLELDIHYFAGAIRICHAGGANIKFVDGVVRILEKLLNTTIRWDSSQLGCFSSKDPTIDDALQEVAQWVRAKPDREMAVYLDNDDNIAKWGLVRNVTASVRRWFGDLVFTPAMKQQLGRWPSLDEMTHSGKRVIVISRVDYGAEMSESMFSRDEVWDEYAPGEFHQYPDCRPVSPGGDRLVRINSDALQYAWFYKPERYIDAKLLFSLNQCSNINVISTDLLTPQLAESTIWSWARGEPLAKQVHEGNCTVVDMTVEGGRWVLSRCDERLPAACQSVHDENKWIISQEPQTFSQSVCLDGYRFWRPDHGGINAHLLAVLNTTRVSRIWVNLRI